MYKYIIKVLRILDRVLENAALEGIRWSDDLVRRSLKSLHAGSTGAAVLEILWRSKVQ